MIKEKNKCLKLFSTSFDQVLDKLGAIKALTWTVKGFIPWVAPVIAVGLPEEQAKAHCTEQNTQH